MRGHLHYFLSHPQFAEYVLSTNQDNYRKHPLFVANFKPFLGTNNLLSSNDTPQWQRDRNLARTAFEADLFFENYTDKMTKNCATMLDAWLQRMQKGPEIPTGFEMDKLALKNINDTLFHGLEIDIESAVKHIPEVFKLITKKATSLSQLPWRLPTKRKRAFDQEVEFIQNVMRTAIFSRWKTGKDYDDLLGTLLHAYDVKDEKSPHFTSTGHQMMTFNVVGYTTTTSALRWILTMLVQYPETEKKVAAEVSKVCNGNRPTYAHFDQLKYTQAFVMEVLRLYPPLVFILRESIAKDDLLGYPVAPKTCILINSFAIHRHRDFWENAEQFHPDRFLDKPYGQENPFAYLPFGAGKRSCIGRNFAFLELCLITAMIVQRFRLSLPQDFQLKMKYVGSVFIRPNVETMFIEAKRD